MTLRPSQLGTMLTAATTAALSSWIGYRPLDTAFLTAAALGATRVSSIGEVATRATELLGQGSRNFVLAPLRIVQSIPENYPTITGLISFATGAVFVQEGPTETFQNMICSIPKLNTYEWACSQERLEQPGYSERITKQATKIGASGVVTLSNEIGVGIVHGIKDVLSEGLSSATNYTNNRLTRLTLESLNPLTHDKELTPPAYQDTILHDAVFRNAQGQKPSLNQAIHLEVDPSKFKRPSSLTTKVLAGTILAASILGGVALQKAYTKQNSEEPIEAPQEDTIK